MSLTLFGEIHYSGEGRGVIGILIDHNKGVVTKVFKGSPASAEGLMVNDQVYLVDNKPRNWEHIDGKVGEKVEIWIDRKGSPLYFEFIRVDSRSLINTGFPQRG
jgi:C-terminal processing protease CtpA/Prc